MITSATGLVVGQTKSIDGVTYIVTKSGVQRLTGTRKQRRANAAKIKVAM